MAAEDVAALRELLESVGAVPAFEALCAASVDVDSLALMGATELQEAGVPIGPRMCGLLSVWQRRASLNVALEHVPAPDTHDLVMPRCAQEAVAQRGLRWRGRARHRYGRHVICVGPRYACASGNVADRDPRARIAPSHWPGAPHRL